jgi:hypothetical protein
MQGRGLWPHNSGMSLFLIAVSGTSIVTTAQSHSLTAPAVSHRKIKKINTKLILSCYNVLLDKNSQLT